MNEIRGSGRTRRQLENAPYNSYFVWCNDIIGYPLGIAKSLGRHDVNVVGIAWLTEHHLEGLTVPVVLDHSVIIDFIGNDILTALRAHSVLFPIK
jgi:hypothetical protein